MPSYLLISFKIKKKYLKIKMFRSYFPNDSNDIISQKEWECGILSFWLSDYLGMNWREEQHVRAR